MPVPFNPGASFRELGTRQVDLRRKASLGGMKD